MGKTNFDDLDLATPGIEADEINSEVATVGQVLTADGTGGVGWATAGFVLAYNTDVLSLEDSSTVDWTDLGLAGVGVPAEAKAVLLALSLQDGVAAAQLNFRPKGSTWGWGGQGSPCLRAVSAELAAGALVVPCGSGEVEYRLNASGVETAYAYGTLLGYWL